MNWSRAEITFLTKKGTIRSIRAAANCPCLTRFALHAPKFAEVEFDTGNVYNLLAEYLRICSPAVDSKTRSVGGDKVISGRRHVEIMSAEPIRIMGRSNKSTYFCLQYRV